MKLIVFVILAFHGVYLQAGDGMLPHDMSGSAPLTGSIEHVIRGDRVVFISNKGDRFVVNLAFIESPEVRSGPWVQDTPYADVAKTVIENQCMGSSVSSVSILFVTPVSSLFDAGFLQCQGIEIGELLVMYGLVYLDEDVDVPQNYRDAFNEARINRLGLHALSE